MTTYDDIFTEFRTIFKTEDINLPNTDQGKYNLIKSAVKHFNSTMETKIKCDDNTETINIELSDNDLIILAHCLKYITLKNQLSYDITTFKPFTKELSLQYYATDVKTLENSIRLEEKEILQLIENENDDFM